MVSFTPVPRHGYRIGVPRAGRYTEILNSDSHFYGGSGVGNGGVELIAEEQPWMEHPYSIVITVPPLGGLVLMPEPLPEPVAVAAVEVEEETPRAAATLATSTPVAAAPAKSAPAINQEELAQPE